MSKLPLVAPLVLSTKAPKHYGISCHSPYDPKRDKGFPTYRDLWDETIRCDVMSWFIDRVSFQKSSLQRRHEPRYNTSNESYKHPTIDVEKEADL